MAESTLIPEGFQIESTPTAIPEGFEIESSPAQAAAEIPDGFSVEKQPDQAPWFQAANQVTANESKYTRPAGAVEDFMSRWHQGFVDAGLNAVAGVSELLERAAPFSEQSERGIFGEIALKAREWAKANQEWSRESQNPDLDDSWAAAFGTGGGQFGPQIGAAALSGTVSVLANVGQMFEQEYTAAKESGADDATAVQAGLANLPAAALDWVGERAAIGKLLPDGWAGRGLKTLAAAVLEGSTEVVQDEYSKLVATGLGYDPNRKTDALKSFVVGSVLGGGVAAMDQGGSALLESRAKQTAAQVGPATEQAVQGVLPDQPIGNATLEPVSQPVTAPPIDFESALASEDLGAAESLLLNPSEAFQTPTDLLAADQPVQSLTTSSQPVQNLPENEQMLSNETAQTPQTTLQPENLGTDNANAQALVDAESGPGLAANQAPGTVLTLGQGDTPAALAWSALGRGEQALANTWNEVYQGSGIDLNNASVRDDIESSFRVNWTEEGLPVLEINPARLAELDLNQLNAALDEELIHVENINAVRSSWDRALGDFQTHLDSEMSKVVQEARELGISGDSEQLYQSGGYSEALEVLRHIIQGRRTGTVTEAFIAPERAPTIRGLLEKILAKFRQIISTKPNSTIASYVKNIETALYGESDIQVEQGQQNAPPVSTQPAGSPQKIDESTGLPLNTDGTVTVYHATTQAGKASIEKSGKIVSQWEPDVYFSSTPSGTGYGDGSVVAVNIDPEILILDDEFPDGRRDFRVEVGPQKTLPVKIQTQPPSAPSARTIEFAGDTYPLDEDGRFTAKDGKNYILDEDNEVVEEKGWDEANTAREKFGSASEKAMDLGSKAYVKKFYQLRKENADLMARYMEPEKAAAEAIQPAIKEASDEDLDTIIKGSGVKKPPKSRAKKEELASESVLRMITGTADIWQEQANEMLASETMPPSAPVASNFLQPANAPQMPKEAPTSYTEYQGKQFPVYSAEKIRKSQGAFGADYFYAPSTQSLWSQSAADFLAQFPSTPDGMREASNLINDPSAPMDDATKNYVRSQIQVNLINMASSGNLIERTQANSILDQVGSQQLQSGTSEAQALASRAGANKLLQPFGGYLAGRRILVERQESEVGKKFEQGVENRVRQASDDAGRAANQVLEQAAESETDTPQSKDFDRLIGAELRRMLNQINRAEGVSWKDIFNNMPLGSQRERQDYMKRMISGHPALQNLTQAQQDRLNSAIQLIWAKERQRIFRDNLNREGALGEKTKADQEKVIKEAPKLLQYLNAGNLTASDFRDILSEQYGISSLNGPQMQRMKELAQKAFNEPEGVVRNQTLVEIERILFRLDGIDPLDILKNSFYANTLSSPRTWGDIAVGGLFSGTVNNLTQVVPTIWRKSPKDAYRMFTLFWKTVPEAWANAVDVIKTGDYTRLYDQDKFYQQLLSGGASPEILETLWRESSGAKALTSTKEATRLLYGSLAYVRRFVTALDYIGSLPSREVNILYVANQVSPEMYAEAEAKYNRENASKAEQQAKAELGENAKKVLIQARKREILEAQIDEDTRNRAQEMGRIAALNQDPKGIAGVINQANQMLPFWFRAFAGTVYLRPMLNMVQLATHATPILGITNYYRAHPVFTKWMDEGAPVGSRKLLKPKRGDTRNPAAVILAPDLPIEQRQLIAALNMIGTVLTLGVAAYALTGDDEDKWVEISGGWNGLTNAEKAQLRNEGQRPFAIGIGSKGNRRWFDYKKFSVLATPLGMIGSLNDKKRFKPDEWADEDVGTHILDAVAGGLLYFRDLTMISSLASWFGARSDSDAELGSAAKFLTDPLGGVLGAMVPWSSLQKDIDAWVDPKVYKPTYGFNYWISNIPFARHWLGEGPVVDNLGDPVKAYRYPWSRFSSGQKDDELHLWLSGQTENGNFAPIPYQTKIYDPAKQESVSLKTYSPKLFYQYQVESGQMFKKLLEARLKQNPPMSEMTDDQAEAYLDELRQQVNAAVKKKIQGQINSGRK